MKQVHISAWVSDDDIKRMLHALSQSELRTLAGGRKYMSRMRSEKATKSEMVAWLAQNRPIQMRNLYRLRLPE